MDRNEIKSGFLARTRTPKTETFFFSKEELKFLFFLKEEVLLFTKIL